MPREPSPLRPGKLPNAELAALLGRVGRSDPRVVVGPGIGRDAAVIDHGGGKLLVAKTDPITFATDRIGDYAVHVNANDIACMGARPAWFLATVLLPDGAPPGLPGEIFAQITDACEALGVEVVGGHTEITYRLDRPIVAGAMLGEVDRDRLVLAENARPGDAVILTKGIAIEGTSVLAREAGERLTALGVDTGTLARARDYLATPGISVVREAGAACDAVRVRAMHDPTEGGIATALYELGEACGAGLSIDGDAIEVLPETAEICRAASLDPLGLLASGALLLVVAPEDADATIDAIASQGIAARRVGKLTAAGEPVIMSHSNRPAAVPRFERDEVARFLSEGPDAGYEA